MGLYISLLFNEVVESLVADPTYHRGPCNPLIMPVMQPNEIYDDYDDDIV